MITIRAFFHAFLRALLYHNVRTDFPYLKSVPAATPAAGQSRQWRDQRMPDTPVGFPSHPFCRARPFPTHCQRGLKCGGIRTSQMRYPQNNLLAVFGNLLTERNERVTKPPRKWKDRSDQNSRDFLFIARAPVSLPDASAAHPVRRTRSTCRRCNSMGNPHPREKVFAEESAVMPLHIQKLDGKNIRRAVPIPAM